MRRVGLWSFGGVLVVVGAALLWQNLAGGTAAARLADFWGAIPLILGLELLVTAYIGSRKTPPERVRIHAGAVVGLVVMLVAGIVVSGIGEIDWGNAWQWNLGDFGAYHEKATGSTTGSATLDAAITAVRIEAVTGVWDISGSDKDTVEVAVDVTARGKTLADAEAAVTGAKVLTVARGTTLVVSFDIPGYEPASGARRVNVTCRGTISVPRGRKLSVDLGTGDVSVADMDSDVRVESSTGDILVERVGGLVILHNSTGDITAVNIGGDADITGSTGEVEVDDVGGAIAVTLSTGDVDIGGAGGAVKVRVSTGDCDVEATEAVAGDWNLMTSTGSIDVSFPRASDVSVDASVHTGSITNNLGLQASAGLDRKSTTGVVGAGTYALTISVSTGSITITGR